MEERNNRENTDIKWNELTLKEKFIVVFLFFYGAVILAFYVPAPMSVVNEMTEETQRFGRWIRRRMHHGR